MRSLTNIKKAPFEIAQLLANNSVFKGLLIDDSQTPGLSDATLDELLNQKYISLYPSQVNGNIDDLSRNTSCIILLDSIDFDDVDNNMQVAGNIYIITDSAHIMLSDNRNRLLEIIEQVYKTLDDVKLSSAGEIHISKINYTIFDDFHYGYRINLSFSDQQSRKAEI